MEQKVVESKDKQVEGRDRLIPTLGPGQRKKKSIYFKERERKIMKER